jgi:hypothetical protein
VNNLVDLDALTDADGIGLGRKLSQVDQHAVRRVGSKVEDLLPQGVGEGRVRDKREALGLCLFDGPGNVRHDIAYMVHDQCVFGEVAGVAGLDELRFHLSEMHKGVAPAAGHGTTAPHCTATGVRGPESLLEPRNGLVQVGYQISNVLNLVKHHLSFACRVYATNVGRIIDPFSLGPKPLSPVSCDFPQTCGGCSYPGSCSFWDPRLSVFSLPLRRGRARVGVAGGGKGRRPREARRKARTA